MQNLKIKLKYQYLTDQHNTMAFVYVSLSDCLLNNMSVFRILSHERKEKEVETPKVGRGRGFRNTGKPRPSMEFVASKGRGPLPAAFSREPNNTQGKAFTLSVS